MCDGSFKKFYEKFHFENFILSKSTRQGKIREKFFFSRSGKCQGILKSVREKLNFGKCHGKLTCVREKLNFQVYRPHGSGKLHQLLESPTCTPMPSVYPLQIRPMFVLS